MKQFPSPSYPHKLTKDIFLLFTIQSVDCFIRFGFLYCIVVWWLQLWQVLYSIVILNLLPSSSNFFWYHFTPRTCLKNSYEEKMVMFAIIGKFVPHSKRKHILHLIMVHWVLLSNSKEHILCWWKKESRKWTGKSNCNTRGFHPKSASYISTRKPKTES